jgi:hypothetical protein
MPFLKVWIPFVWSIKERVPFLSFEEEFEGFMKRAGFQRFLG